MLVLELPSVTDFLLRFTLSPPRFLRASCGGKHKYMRVPERRLGQGGGGLEGGTACGVRGAVFWEAAPSSPQRGRADVVGWDAAWADFFFILHVSKNSKIPPLYDPPTSRPRRECAVTCGRRRYVLFPCKRRAKNTLPTRLLLPPAVTKVTQCRPSRQPSMNHERGDSLPGGRFQRLYMRAASTYVSHK